MAKIPRNLSFIFSRLHRFIFCEYIIFVLVFVLMGRPYIISSGLGLLFSFCIMYDFALSQHAILYGKKKGVFFIYYVSRLFLYAVPLMIGLVFKNYFNFFVILIFLFFYQIHYIGFEFFRSLNKVKRQHY